MKKFAGFSQKLQFFHFGQTANLALASVIAVGLYALFGNRIVANVFKKIF